MPVVTSRTPSLPKPYLITLLFASVLLIMPSLFLAGSHVANAESLRYGRAAG